MCHHDDRSFPPGRGGLTETVVVALPGDRTLPAVLQHSRQSTSAILLITDIYGPTDFYLGLAGNLAEHGHTVLIPDFLAGVGTLHNQDRDVAIARARRLDQQAALHDLSISADWLRDRRGATEPEGRIGVLGFCLGGTLGLDMAADRDDLAVVSYYGFPAGVPGENPVPAPVDIADQIHGPVLAFWGEDDYMGMGPVHDLCRGLASRSDPTTHEIYPGVGHGFLGELTSGRAAAIESWQRAREFFAAELGVALATAP